MLSCTSEPGLNITDLADLLARAGAVRAMEFDINTDWMNFSFYAPPSGAAASAANGTELLPSMAGGPSRYFQSWWARDFITMSAVSVGHSATPGRAGRVQEQAVSG